MLLTQQDISSIELATCEAVSPERVERLGQWLVALDRGTVGRAKTAAALTHDEAQAGALIEQISAVQNLYTQAKLAPGFRLADIAGLQCVADVLRAQGFAPEQPTCVMVVPTQTLSSRTATAPAHPVLLSDAPSSEWASVYTSAGFNAQDGAHRVRVLSRARRALYASMRLNNQNAAAGVLALSDQWASVHGLRTAPQYRHQGLCSAVFASMAQAANKLGLERVFLQVEQDNPAISLYQNLGFAPVWRYHYWYKAV
jgi:N-acetylglutamate synthase